MGALAVLLPAAAAAHAIIKPSQSRPADLQQYTLTVPNERDVPTVEVEVKIPAGIGFLLVERQAGWKTVVVRRNDRVDIVRFTSGSIPADFYAAFRFIARNPVQEGVLEWKVLQTYEGGEVVRWIGAADSDSPAPRTTISESAPASEVIDVVSGGSSATTASSASADAREESESSQTVPIVLAAVALAVAVAALVASLWRRRDTGA